MLHLMTELRLAAFPQAWKQYSDPHNHRTEEVGGVPMNNIRHFIFQSRLPCADDQSTAKHKTRTDL